MGRLAKKARVSIPDEEIPASQAAAGDENLENGQGAELPPDYPPLGKPGQRVHIDDFYNWLDLLTEEHQKRFEFYVYDDYPVKKPGVTGYLEKIPLGSKLDRDYLLLRHGSGTYRIWVKDRMSKNGDSTVVKLANITIRNPSFPPIRSFDRIALNDPANKDYVDHMKALGKLDARGEPVQEAKTVVAAPDSTPIVKALEMVERSNIRAEEARNAQAPIGEVYKHAAAEAISLVKSQQANNGPGTADLLALATSLNAPMMTMMLENQKSLREELNFARQQAAEDRKLMTELITRLSSGGGAATKTDLIKEASQMIELAKMMSGSAGGGSSASEWASVAKEVAPALMEAATAFRMSRMPPQQQSVQQRAQESNGSMPTPQPQPAAAGPKTEAQKIAEVTKIMQNPLFSGILLNAYRTDTGFNFAYSVVVMRGRPTYDQIAAFGPNAIYHGSMAVPAIAETFAGIEDKFKEFITDFIAYGQEETAAGASEEADKPAAVDQ